MTTATEKRSEKQEALEYLKNVLKPGDTVYTVLRSVSKSGMFRRMDVYAIKDNRPVWLTGSVAKVLSCRYTTEDWKQSKGLGVSGCGMDMGFHVVNNLSMALFCPEKYTHEGAYALKHKWI